MWPESEDPELVKLRQKATQLSNLLAGEQQTNFALKTSVAELKKEGEQATYKLHAIEGRAVQAEEQLRKRTEELKQCQVQKSNALQTVLSLEKDLKAERAETKRVTFELEVASSRSTTAGSALVQEKAGLALRVQQLTDALKKSEAALEKEKENVGARASSHGNTSRSSISPADAPRNRFGFGAPAKGRASLLPDPTATPARPASALSSHSNILAPSTAISKRRRSSSFSGIPTSNAVATSSAPRIAQLERELSDARTRVESAESDFLGVKTKLAGRERELINIENRLLAAERSKSDEITKLKDKLEDAFDAVEEGKQQAALARDTLRTELDKIVKQSREDKTSLLAKIERMRVELEKKEAELERNESAREDLEQQLAQAKDDDKLARAKSAKALEDAQAAQVNLEREVAQLKQELKAEAGKEAARERMEQELENVANELAEVKTKTTKAIEDLRHEKLAAERALESVREELQAETGKRDLSFVDDEQKARLESEVEEVKKQLEGAEDKIKQLESRDVVSAEQAKADVEKVEQQRQELQRDFMDAVEEIQRLEKDREFLVDQLSGYEEKEVEWQKARTDLESAVAEGQKELDSIKAQHEALRSDTADLPSQHDSLTAELVQLNSTLALKESEVAELSARLASIEETHSNALSTSQQGLDDALAAKTLAETTVGQLEQERDILKTTLGGLESELASLIGKHAEELATSTAAVEKAETFASSLKATIEQLEHQRDSATQEFTEVNAALDTLRSDAVEATRLRSEHSETIVTLERVLQERDEQIAVLEKSAAEVVAPSRSFDDSHVDDLEQRLAQAEAHIIDLTAQVAEMDQIDSLRSHERQTLEEKATALQHTIEKLEDELEELDASTREELNVARADLASKDQLVDEASARVEQVEALLARKEDEFTTIAKDHAQCSTLSADLEIATARVSTLTEAITSATAELDTLRSTTEETSLSHMQETSDFQRRLTSQETVIHDLEEELAGLDALRLVLSREQAKVVGLEQDFARATAATATSDSAASERLAALTARAERAEEDVHRLRSQLDDATAQLVDSRELLARNQVENQLTSSVTSDSPTTSPTSPSFSYADASVLVCRLREERDDLRARLDFARNEASFRVLALQQRLQEVDELKAREVSQMEVQLVERTAQLGVEKEAREKAEETAKGAKADVGIVELALAQAEEKVSAAEERLEALSSTLQADLNTSRAALKESSRQVVAAREAAEHSKLALEEATARVQRLESAVEIVKEGSSDPAPPADQSLQQEIEDLQARILRRTETIGRHEQTIAQLETRLASLEDDEDDADTAEIDRPSTVTPEDLYHLKEQLDQEVSARAGLEEEVQAVTKKLEEVCDALTDTQAHAAELNDELQAALETEAKLEKDLGDAQAQVEAARLEHQALQAEHKDLQAQYDILEADYQEHHAQLESLHVAHRQTLLRVNTLEVELSDANDRHADAVAELDSSRASFEALRPSLLIMETRLEETHQQVSERDDRLRSLCDEIDQLQDEKTRLTQELDGARNLALTSSADVDRVAGLQAELDTLRTSLSAAETQLTLAHASNNDLVSTHLTAMQQLKQQHAHDLAELARVSEELTASKARFEELEAARISAEDARQRAQDELDDLSARLTTTTAELSQAQAAVEQTTADLTGLREQLETEVTSHRRHLEELLTLQSRLDATSADLAVAQEQSAQRIAQLEQELANSVQAMDASEQASRVELDEASRRLEQVSAEKREVAETLGAAQAEVAALNARLQDTSRGSSELELLEGQLHSAQREIEGLGELVQAEQEALKSQKEALAKVESARDAAMRENKTLRALARGAETDVEALKNENARLDKVAAALEQDNVALDHRLREIEETSQAHLTELLDTLQAAEERKAEVERQVVNLTEQVQDLEASLASQPDSAELDETIKELTQQLEIKNNEVEETEERYIEVLKAQKRSTASIERLKSKIAVLTRDLAEAKVAPLSAAAAPSARPPTLNEPSSLRKKRQAPSSDTEPAALPPRALVERPTRTPAKENDIARLARPLSAKKAIPVDMVVPLKEAAPSPPTIREVLSVKAGNGTAVLQPAAGDMGKPLSNVESLRLRMAAQKAAKKAAA